MSGPPKIANLSRRSHDCWAGVAVEKTAPGPGVEHVVEVLTLDESSPLDEVVSSAVAHAVGTAVFQQALTSVSPLATYCSGT